MIQFPDGAKVISWLPSAHIAERAAHHYLPIVYAMTITCCDNPREVVSYLPLVKPTWFFAVPRIWEKLKAGLEAMLAGQPAEQREPAQAALDAAIRKVELEQAGEPVPEELAAAVAAADAKMFAGLRAMLGLDEVVVGQRRRGADAARGARVLPRHRDRAGGAVGDVRDLRLGLLQPARKGPHRDRRAARAGRRDHAGGRRRGADALAGRDARLPQPAREDGRGARPRRLAAHRRHRRVRRPRLPADRRPQEGADHLRGRQEHVAGQHRGDDEGRVAADRPGRRDRGRPPLQHRADRARRRLRARLGGPERARGRVDRGPRRRRADARGGPGRRRRGQRAARARRAGQEVHDHPGRLGARRRRADPDHEAQAPADRARSTRTRSRRCTGNSGTCFPARERVRVARMARMRITLVAATATIAALAAPTTAAAATTSCDGLQQALDSSTAELGRHARRRRGLRRALEPARAPDHARGRHRRRDAQRRRRDADPLRLQRRDHDDPQPDLHRRCRVRGQRRGDRARRRQPRDHPGQRVLLQPRRRTAAPAAR